MITCNNENCREGKCKDGHCTDSNILACFARVIRPVFRQPDTPETIRQAEERTFNREEVFRGVRVGDLFDWLKDVPERAIVGYLIEDDVVEIHPYDDFYTYGHFCLASGAKSSKRSKKSV